MRTLWLAITYMLIVACSASQSPPVIYVNDHWQQHNNDKLMFCYQRMETINAVESCLLTIGVYI